MSESIKEKMTREELLDYQLTRDDYEITLDGILIKHNSNMMLKILNDQKLANELKSTHAFYTKSGNGNCAGVTYQILQLSNYGGKLIK